MWASTRFVAEGVGALIFPWESNADLLPRSVAQSEIVLRGLANKLPEHAGGGPPVVILGHRDCIERWPDAAVGFRNARVRLQADR